MTPLERLKALAAAKKAQEAKNVSQTQAQETSADSAGQQVPAAMDQSAREEDIQDVPSAEVAAQESKEVEVQSVPSSAGNEVLHETEPKSEHPLIMELAELEEALTQNIPDFRLILRNIHQKLRADPELVTVLSEEEIGLIVSGLATHAQAEIIAPKAVKAARATARKTPISASDL